MPYRTRASTPRGGAASPSVTLAAEGSYSLVRQTADYVMDGNRDDRDIRNAILMLPSVGGKLNFSEGTADIGQSLVLGGRRVTVEGCGTGVTTLRMANSTNLEAVLDIGQSTSITAGGRIANLTIDCNKANNLTAGIGIRIRGCVLLVLENVEIINARQEGIYIDGNSGYSAAIVVLLNCRVNGSSRNGVFRGEYVENFQVIGGTYDANGTAGQLFASFFLYRSSSDVFTNCVVSGGLGPNFWLHGVNQAFFSNVYSLSAGYEDYRLTGGSANIVIQGGNVHACSGQSSGVYYHFQLGVNDAAGALPAPVGGTADLRTAARILVLGVAVTEGTTVAAGVLDELSQGSDNLIAFCTNEGTYVAINIRGTRSKQFLNNRSGNEGTGTATIPSGSTSVVVTHGLRITPTAAMIQVTPTNNPTNDPGNFWVDTITSTQFTIGVRANPGLGGATFSWQVIGIA